MKHVFWALLITGGLFITTQGANAAFVFNPTLTMAVYHPATHMRRVKVTAQRENDRRPIQKAVERDLEDADAAICTFPRVSLSK
jgi:hypothetical protein